uniref:Small ribosomal subunit protein mS29 n=1 Tax=Odontella aurita TaxID=265563 RepID=A0A7S4N195_9STRA|mmetsp:Transcript_43399/g.132031  ORF Transcript_43399/g.132031 Transcript_43399/m.132031 type:complete len:773 (+) Transcript_43399:113-2431(+)
MLRLAARSSARGAVVARRASRAVAGLDCSASSSDGTPSPRETAPSQRRHLGLYRSPDKRNLNDGTSKADVYDEAPPDMIGLGAAPPPAIKTADDMMDYDVLTDDWGVNPDDFAAPRIESEEEREARFEAEEEKEEAKRQAVRDELDARTGRGWTDPWEIEESEWYKDRGWDDAPVWSPDVCSRVSKERLVVLEDVPTLEGLARTAVPPGRTAHPSNVKDKSDYLGDRVAKRRARIRSHIDKIAGGGKIESILAMEDWAEKQDAVDELHEEVEAAVRKREEIWAAQPRFGNWIEREMEAYLLDVAREEREKFEAAAAATSGEGDDDAEQGDDGDSEGDGDAPPPSLPTPEEDASSVPKFLNLLPSGSRPKSWETDGEGRIVRTTDTIVPDILHPLSLHHRGKGGRLVEEWELSAHPGCRHVMMRQATRDVARMLWEADNRTEGERVARIMLTGKKGCGKTSALATLVASARTSGNIVMYLPDGDRLRHLGKYIQPSKNRKHEDGGLLFNLPVLSREVCGQLLHSHEDDLDGMTVPEERLGEFFGKDALRRFRDLAPDAAEGCGEVKIVDLLRAGSEKENIAAACYALSVDHLLHVQDDKPFLVVMDEFNCFFDHLHYFHGAYDEKARYGIPPQRITLFKPLLDVLGLYRAETIKGFAGRTEGGPRPMKRGGIVVATSEGRAVAGKFTSKLVEVATEEGEGDGDSSSAAALMERVEVPAYSKLEVEHALANFEVTGIGRLRFDKGSTVMDDQEVEYLRMVSSSVPQQLMEACIV